jgi:hypothetical protein
MEFNMRKKFLFLKSVTVCALFIFGSAAHANIFSSSLNADVCSNVEGPWVGDGTVSAKVFGKTVRCDYKGGAYVSAAADPHSFQLAVDLTLESGLCPPSAKFDVPGNCNGATGLVTIKTADANLEGLLSPDGNYVNLTGTVTLPVMGKDVVGTVERMELHKV